MDRKKVANELVLVAKDLLAADKWKKMPKGWTDESRKKFWDSLVGDVKHKVTKCIKQMDGKVDNPGAVCAALADRSPEAHMRYTGKLPRSAAEAGIVPRGMFRAPHT